jgi:hypothetical protein
LFSVAAAVATSATNDAWREVKSGFELRFEKLALVREPACTAPFWFTADVLRDERNGAGSALIWTLAGRRSLPGCWGATVVVGDIGVVMAWVSDNEVDCLVPAILPIMAGLSLLENAPEPTPELLLARPAGAMVITDGVTTSESRECKIVREGGREF